MSKERILWLADSDIGKAYETSTYYRCVKIGEFIETVEAKHKIVAVTFEGNNIGFILDNKDV